MQSLLEWAGTVAGIVVFAGLLEMLVPSNAMKRYVQLTMGLLVLLTLLGPVLGVLQRTRDLGWETEAAWASNSLSLDSVLAKAGQIRQGNRERQLQVYRTSLEQAALHSATPALRGRAAAAQVFLGESPPEGGPPPVKRIVLILDPKPRSPSEGGAPPEAETAPVPSSGGAMAPVEPVSPVEVNLTGETPTTASPAGNGQSAALDPQTLAAVRRAVAEALGLDPAQIEVRGKSYEE